MITIIDYGTGNLKSIQNMFWRVGMEAIITPDIRDIWSAEKLVLPGVGAFGNAVAQLQDMHIGPILQDRIIIKGSHCCPK